MANAKRRTQRSNRTNARITAYNLGTATAVDSEESRTSVMVNWEREWKFIRHDLRELLIISVCLFTLLFVVGFFI